ncbi:hypothetical protein LZ32DRAFT_687880 [Colletotrichum eremochloae]|nr:hypothetical protein LZ32DRAFT_687880 [Colletotrichum eremochloae]
MRYASVLTCVYGIPGANAPNSTAECFVPSRLFRPELDTLFCQIGGATLENITGEDELEPILQETRHLAVSGKKEYINLLAWILLFYFPKLETLSVIVDDLSPDSCFKSYFEAPKTRCKLRRIPGESARAIIRGAKKSVDVGIPGPVHLFNCMRNYTYELEKLMAEHVEDMDSATRNSHQWWDNESNTVRKIKYSIQLFVEYTVDGAFRLNEFVEEDDTSTK